MEQECTIKNNNSLAAKSGYDIPVVGLGNSCFYKIHVTAMVCLILSLTCAVLVVIALFKSKTRNSFMKWPKHERFLVYRCICNSIYCLVQMLDHIQILIVLDHVRPPGLCSLYAILLINVCMAESSFSLISALNAFVSITFRKNVDFGQRDWKLLTSVFIVGPIVFGLFVGLMDWTGPSGFFCGFDSVKGVIANAILSTGSISAILVSLSILYVLTWWRIYIEAKKLKTSIPDGGSTRNATLKSAKAMCLFVAVYIIQWSPLSIYGTWQLISDVPFSLFMAVVLSTNVGGILSGIIYLVNSKSRNSVASDSSMNKGKFKAVQNRYSQKLSPIKPASKKPTQAVSSKTTKEDISTPTTEKF